MEDATTVTDENLTVELNKMREVLLEKSPIAKQTLDFNDLESLNLFLGALEMRSSSLRNEMLAVVGAKFPASNMSSLDEVLHLASVDFAESAAVLKKDADRAARDLVARESLSSKLFSDSAEKTGYKLRIAELNQLIEALDALAKFQACSEEFDVELKNARYVSAARLLQRCETVLTPELTEKWSPFIIGNHGTGLMNNNLDGSELSASSFNSSFSFPSTNVASMLKAVKLQMHQKKASISVRLNEHFEKNCFQVKTNLASSVFGAFEVVSVFDVENRKVSYGEVCEGLTILGLSPAALSLLIEKYYDSYFKLFSDGNAMFRMASKNCLEIVHANKETRAAEEGVARVDLLFANILVLLKFFFHTVCVNSKEIDNLKTLSYELFHDRVEKQALESIGDCLNEEVLKNSTELREKCQAFESEVSKTSFSFISTNKFSTLSMNVFETYGNRLRKQILSDCRSVLKSSELSNQVVAAVLNEQKKSEKEKFTLIKPMLVSKQASMILELLERTLALSSEAKEAVVSKILYETCRDVLQAWFTLSSVHSTTIDKMIRRNDWEYLGENLLLFGFDVSYACQDVKQSIVFLDFYPSFMGEAKKILEKEIDTRSRELQNFLNMIDSNPKKWSTSKCFEVYDALLTSWEKSLPLHVLLVVRSELIEKVGEFVIGEVLDEDREPLANVQVVRQWSLALSQIVESIEKRASTVRVLMDLKKICGALSPHMSLPLFKDQVAEEFADWNHGDVLRLATLIYSHSSTPQELKEFENSLSYY